MSPVLAHGPQIREGHGRAWLGFGMVSKLEKRSATLAQPGPATVGGSNHPGAGESRVGRGPHRSWVWGPRPPLQQVRPLSSTHASHGPSRSKATRTRELRPWGPLAQPPGTQQVREGWRSLAGEDPMKPSAPCPGGRACTEFASGFAGGRPRVLPRQL